jgi:uncharacterized protein (DUF305 family)
METKPLLYGLIGFFIGGLLVSVAATTFDKPQVTNNSMMSMSMNDMATQLQGKTGDDFDEAFLSGMIVHHQGAVAMAELAEKNAKHEEIKRLSRDIFLAQNEEIDTMRQWQIEWGYPTSDNDDHGMMH